MRTLYLGSAAFSLNRGMARRSPMVMSEFIISEVRLGFSNFAASIRIATPASFPIFPSSAAARVLISVSLSSRSLATLSNISCSERVSNSPCLAAFAIADSTIFFTFSSSTFSLLSANGTAFLSRFLLASTFFCSLISTIWFSNRSISFSYSLTSAISFLTGSVSNALSSPV